MKGNFKQVNTNSFLSLIFSSSSSSSSSFFISAFSDSPFLIVSNLLRLSGYSCKGSTKVVRICLSWFQCSYLAYFNKIGFLGTLMDRIVYFPLFPRISTRGAGYLKGAPKKLLLDYRDDLS